MKLARIALIGFGEAGSILGTDLAARGVRVRAYDLLSETAAGKQQLQAPATQAGVQLCNSAAEACAEADLVISAVTACAALDVARQLAAQLRSGQLYLDINSVAPTTKCTAAELVQTAGAGYIDAAVMAPVPPKRLGTPMLLGGAQAETLATALNALGCNTRAVADIVGTAAAIKMCRSVIIKGLEALTAECLAAARQYGAETEVLASLQQSFPAMGWDGELPDYLISRIAEHGRRRAEEMQEVSKTLADAGVTPHLSRAIASSQRGLVDAMNLQDLRYSQFVPFSWRDLFARLYGSKPSPYGRGVNS